VMDVRVRKTTKSISGFILIDLRKMLKAFRIVSSSMRPVRVRLTDADSGDGLASFVITHCDTEEWRDDCISRCPLKFWGMGAICRRNACECTRVSYEGDIMEEL
jgi:hypothetical protein